MSPIFEARLTNKEPNASIKYIDVRVDNARIDSLEKCLALLERTFPLYDIQNIVEGYKRDE